ncbi:DoxX family protein [Chryseobacterium capnotolerans]|uniref:DoxX family protein n=1 Tax=Chryseobacterium TaxID=59732 RepID=UPI00083AF91E|nr:MULTISPECIES: DoxX family protein [Chryseobacterium]UHO39514.1 DoxX family protein [Chryseobacterium capnotolerans]
MDKKLKQWFSSTQGGWGPLILRLTLGIVLFPHAAQKLFGWFDGPGLQGEMQYMTTHVGLPPFIAVIAIAIECLGTFCILLGIGTKITSIAIFFLFIGMIVVDHASHGFFMNWFGKMPAGAEGFEYHLLVLGICLTLIIQGGGKYSMEKQSI